MELSELRASTGTASTASLTRGEEPGDRTGTGELERVTPGHTGLKTRL
jgi:hypothetical protein